MKYILITGLAIILTGGIWLLFRGRNSGTTPTMVARSGPAPVPDPFAGYRQNAGSWDPGKFNGQGLWVILEQDLKKFFQGNALSDATGKLSSYWASLEAYMKGFDIQATSWQLRSVVLPKFIPWVVQNGFLTPDEVVVGQFIQG
ncbi:MAG: hypothetical protein AAFV07_12585 [Bacteroidota bacterium]